MAKLTLEFSGKTEKILQDLASEVGTTKVDIIRRALALYEYAVEETKQGRRISVTKDDKIIKDVVNIT
mgnify:CR=1 FL=1